MLAQVEVRTAVDTLYLLEAERHLKLDVGSCIGIVSQFLVIVVTILLVAQSQSLVPFQTGLFPFLEPLHLFARTNEELHLHLFELAHTEDELASHNLVTEGLTNLSDTEGHLHTACLLYVQEVHEDTLSRFRTQIYLHGSIGCRTHLGREHQVELTHVGPVACTRNRADNLTIQDQLAQILEVRVVHIFGIAGMNLIPLGLMLQHAWVSSPELSLVELVAKAFGSLGHLLVDLFLDLA